MKMPLYECSKGFFFIFHLVKKLEMTKCGLTKAVPSFEMLCVRLTKEAGFYKSKGILYAL